jgi:MFS family permease
MSNKDKWYRISVILTSWLAVFCLFGYRATFALLKDPMSTQLGWSQAQVSLGYSLMMLFYAITAFFSGLLLDRWGTRPAYLIAAVFSFLGFYLTSYSNSFHSYLLTFGFLGGMATGMLWVTSTVSVRKWFVGKTYATIWGIVFMGAPLSQLLLTNLTRGIMESGESDDWRIAMRILGVLMLIAMSLAVLIAKRNPEHYGMRPSGLESKKNLGVQAESLTVKQCYGYYAMWGVILTFLFSMMAEFLIWTQVISYWTDDLAWTRGEAIKTYSLIGLIGIISMPIMGVIADRLVKKSNTEAEGRRRILIVGTFLGMAACVFLLLSGNFRYWSLLACLLFAIYWAIIPGGVVGYTGSVFGAKNLGKIWGLATLIVMGIGPFTGTLAGGLLKDISGSYRYAVYFSLFSFMLAVFFALSLPSGISRKRD